MEFCCLLFEGSGLTDKVRNLLFNEAQALFSEKKKSKKIKTTWCTGRIKTKLEYRGISGLYGYIFYAEIEWGNKSTHVEFLAKQKEIPPGKKLTWTKQQGVPVGPPINMN